MTNSHEADGPPAAPDPATTRVVVYTREGCHLCDEAIAVVERVRAQAPFALELIDIERDDALLRAYLERIPVVTIDGREEFTFHVDEAMLRERLQSR